MLVVAFNRDVIVAGQEEKDDKDNDQTECNQGYSCICSDRSSLSKQMLVEKPTRLHVKVIQQQMQLAVMQMQDNADQRIAELEYQKSRDRKEDLQYNERMEELDRKDRRAMMQNMAMGLASLGAAFAI